MAKLEPGQPFTPVKGGGYSSPESLHVGEVGTSRGGMTIWDEYATAAIPAVVARVNNLDPEQWGNVGAACAMVADLLLIERARRGIGNAE